MKKKIILIICLICLALMSCGEKQEHEIEVLTAEEGDTDTVSNEFEISYEKIEYTPNVIVNQFGYDVENEKYVYFRGEDLAEIFYVYEQGTDALIYEGSIVQTSEEGYAFGEFTDLKQEGTYYIQTAKIGESYPFTIMVEREYDQIYHTLLDNFSKQDINRYKDYENIDEIFPILIAHEMYPTAFFDGDIYEVPNGIPDVLDYLIEIANLLIEETPTEGVNELFANAAFLGKLSYALDGYDKDLALQYRKEANLIYKDAETILRNAPDQGNYYAEAYLAATELYRINGGYGYKTECQIYAEEIPSSDTKDNYVFYADMTLMSTRRSVDVTFCNSRMEEVRTQVVAWNEKYGTHVFFYPSDGMNELISHGMEMLWILSLDYNEEYANFNREILDFVTGLNRDGLSYVSEIGYTISEDTLSENIEMNNQYLIMISKYMQQEEQE